MASCNTSNCNKLAIETVATALINKYNPKFYGGKYFFYQTDTKLGVYLDKNRIGYVEIDKIKLTADIWKLSKKLKNDLNADKPEEITRSFVNGILYYLEQEGLILEKDINKDLMYVNNGILDTNSCEIIESDEDTFVPLRIPITYDKFAGLPVKIDYFFTDVITPKDETCRKEDYSDDVQTLYEFAGFLLDPEYSIPKALFLTGKQRNGKDTYLNLLTSFVGTHNHFPTSLYDLAGDRFAMIELHNKMFGSRSEMGYDKLSGRGMQLIKDLTGGSSEISARHIKDTHYTKFYNRCKLGFAANELPSANLKDDAFIDRWIILNFPNYYQQNREFARALHTEKELSGLLNMALDARKTLQKHEHFTKNQPHSELYELFAQTAKHDVRVVDQDDNPDVLDLFKM